MSRNLKLNVFGDSYSTPEFCVAAKESFWGLTAHALGVDCVDNFSHPGFSLDHIMHIILNEEFDFCRDYFVIGIPPLIRYVAYSDTYKSTWTKCSYTNSLDVVQNTVVESLSNTQKFTFEHQFKNNKQDATRFNSEWNDVYNLEKIFLLHQYLMLKNAKFIIVNLSNPIHYQDMWPAGKSIMNKIYCLDECVVFDNTYYSVNYIDGIKPADFDKYSWQGHHGAEGNKNWYNKVIELKIKKLGWINA